MSGLFICDLGLLVWKLLGRILGSVLQLRLASQIPVGDDKLG